MGCKMAFENFQLTATFKTSDVAGFGRGTDRYGRFTRRLGARGLAQSGECGENLFYEDWHLRDGKLVGAGARGDDVGSESDERFVRRGGRGHRATSP